MNESISCMLMYCRALVDAGLDEDATQAVRVLRIEGVQRAHSRALYYYEQGFSCSVIDASFDKMLKFVLQATTKKEIEDIMAPERPRWYAGQVVCDGPYYKAEEELLLWLHVSPQCKLHPKAEAHMQEVYNKVNHELGLEQSPD